MLDAVDQGFASTDICSARSIVQLDVGAPPKETRRRGGWVQPGGGSRTVICLLVRGAEVRADSGHGAIRKASARKESGERAQLTPK